MMFAARKAAVRLLPLLVVVWATFAVLGGALYLAKHSGPPQDSLAEAGMGLCAATAALLVGIRAGITSICRPGRPPAFSRRARPSPPPVPFRSPWSR